MATPYNTLGSPTTGGGKVISGQSSFLIEGKPIACVGDKATCPKHKCVSTIVSGDNHMIVMGKPAAQHNSPLSCGCKCIGDQHLTVGDNGSSSLLSIVSNLQPVISQQNLTNSLVDDTDKKKDPCAPECVVETVSFNSTPGPYIISMEMWKKFWNMKNLNQSLINQAMTLAV